MLNKIKERYLFIIPFGLSFYFLDFFIRYQNLNINFGSMVSLSTNFFTLAWVSFFAAVLLILGVKLRKIFYFSTYIFFALLMFLNFIYFSFFNSFFSFKNISLASEGMDYFSMALNYLKWPVVLTLISSIVLVLISQHFFPKDKTRSDIVVAIILFTVFLGSYYAGRYFLGEKADVLLWDAWNYKRNIYDDYSDTRKSLQVSGLYEYVIRDIKLTLDKKGVVDPSVVKYLDDYFATSDISSLSIRDNNDVELRGKYKDKNVILVLMESIDDWLVTEDTMPTVYQMMNEGINFTNHYAPIYSAGATFNSEFTINTGNMTPFNGGLGAYSYKNNLFTYSLPNILKSNGYKHVNEFHFNFGDFYNRTLMAKTFGYDNYYGSYELGYAAEIAVNDSHFMTEKELKNLILPNDKFLSFIVTYSAHVPYSLNGLECQLAIPDDDDRTKAKSDEEMNCLKAQAGNTDKFFKLLLEKLEEEDLIDDTIIVGITDHYNYGFSDKERLYKLKETKDENMISKIPFFIWSSEKPSYEVEKVNSNLDVLPTIAYLLGIEDGTKYYLGKNILDPNYDGFVFFGDYSWYDGQVYYKNNKVIIGENVEQEYIDNRNKQLKTILDINKKVLETNYFNTLSND